MDDQQKLILNLFGLSYTSFVKMSHGQTVLTMSRFKSLCLLDMLREKIKINNYSTKSLEIRQNCPEF